MSHIQLYIRPGSRSREVTHAKGRSRCLFLVIPNYFLFILDLWIIVKSKMKERFGISAHALTVYDPPCVKAIRGHLMPFEVTDLG